MNDLPKLREIANAATPGAWESSVFRVEPDADNALRGAGVIRAENGRTVFMSANGPEILVSDATHIATFDPPTVLALLDEIEKLRRWKAEMVQILDGLNKLAQAAEVPPGGQIIETATKRIEELRAALGGLAKNEGERPVEINRAAVSDR